MGENLDSSASAVAPLYLFVCLVFGGSDWFSWREAVVDATGIAIIVWAATARADEPLPRSAVEVLVLALVAIAMVAVRALPLPSLFWVHGFGWAPANIHSVVGRSAARTVMSVVSSRPWSMLLASIPPLAIFCAIVLPQTSRRSWLLAGLLAGAFLEIVEGVLQESTSPSSRLSVFQDHRFVHSFASFANGDHAANLFLVTLPFIAAIAAPSEHRHADHQSGLLLISAAIGALMIAAIALTGSTIGCVLTVPVLAASALILIPSRSSARTPMTWIAAVLAVGAVATLIVGPELRSRTRHGQMIMNGEALPSLSTTADVIAQSMPLGRGPGPTSRVIALGAKTTGHLGDRLVPASNEYAEIALDFGVPGLVLLGLFLVWWARAVLLAWRPDQSFPLVQAASVASGATLVHSLLDFPLRTTAICAVFAMCVALLAERRRPRTTAPADFRPSRHLVIH